VTSRAFRRAERARKKFQPVSKPQRRTLVSLSRRAGIEVPQVRTKDQASDALDRLESFLTQPVLEGFGVSTGAEGEGAR
jgi:hypothetical protein